MGLILDSGVFIRAERQGLISMNDLLHVLTEAEPETRWINPTDA